MRTRHEIEEDSKDRFIYSEKLILEVLLDMREQLEEIKEYMKHIK